MPSLDQFPPEVQAALASDLTIDITTIGRHSGAPRRIEIWFLNIDGGIYITGTPVHATGSPICTRTRR